MKSIYVILAFLISQNAFADINFESIMKVSAQSVIESGMSLDMPDCDQQTNENLMECVIEQGWGDFDSSSFDSNNLYEGTHVILYYKNKSDLNESCYLQVTVDASLGVIASLDATWSCSSL